MKNVQNEVSVIGLGMMGSTLAHLALRRGYSVTVWNRTSAKAEPLVWAGAVLAPSAAGHENEEVAALIKVFRAGSGTLSTATHPGITTKLRS